MKTKVQKWGNRLAVRLPSDIAQEAGVHVDDVLEVEVVRGKIVLTPTKINYDLGAMVKKINPRNRYRESDFGKPQGRE